MGKVFEFRPGSYIDQVSGAVGVNTNGELVRSEKGISYRCNGSDDILYDTLTYIPAIFSIECWIKRSDQSTDDRSAAGSKDSEFQPVRIRDNTWYAYISTPSPTSVNTATYIDTEWNHMVMINITNGTSGTIYCYLNGVFIHSQNTNFNADLPISKFAIGIAGTSDYFVGDIGRVILYNHAITEKERAKLYSEFLRSVPNSKIIE
jgi:hypothetical protein